jgi:hypothetical protein
VNPKDKSIDSPSRVPDGSERRKHPRTVLTVTECWRVAPGFERRKEIGPKKFTDGHPKIIHFTKKRKNL